jgi:sigma-B regulation protein RsbU (phosphoserine phosphatase)
MSGRLTGPLVKLAGHVARVGRGDFESRLELDGARELKEVAGEVNRMAAGLRERVVLEQSMALASHVQKSLLPAGPPVSPGVEVAGQSRYCDATGGDYYDFIDVRKLAGDGVLIAVGDVMGHGIGAAMLMATARAALRAAAGSARSLGELMGCVNRVLSEDARHGLFMTMALVRIDPSARRVRWASAGHDPTIVYDPASGEFAELDGGDVPLGISDGVGYEEYERELGTGEQVLVVGTDGIWEARDERGEMFGKERLRDAIRTTGGGTAAEIATGMEDALGRFVGRAKVVDDVTFVVARVRAVGRRGREGERAGARADLQV